MNLNIATYLIFFALIVFVMVKVGWLFYKNGEHYIHDLIPEDPHLVASINKLLLIGYYLLNIGYAAIVVSNWKTVTSVKGMISSLSFKMGYIIIGLGIIHFMNLFILNQYKEYRNKKVNKINNTKS